MSPKSGFLDSPFKWDDVLFAGFTKGYSVNNSLITNYQGCSCYYFILNATTRDSFSRLDLIINKARLLIKKIIYYTPSREIVKTAEFTEHILQAGTITTYTVLVRHSFLPLTAVLRWQGRKPSAKGKSWFDPRSIGALPQRRNFNMRSF